MLMAFVLTIRIRTEPRTEVGASHPILLQWDFNRQISVCPKPLADEQLARLVINHMIAWKTVISSVHCALAKSSVSSSHIRGHSKSPGGQFM